VAKDPSDRLSPLTSAKSYFRESQYSARYFPANIPWLMTEAIAYPMFACFVWDYGGFATILQEVCQSLKSKGFKLNPYDSCVANKQVKGEQLTVCFHVDDCKISHVSPKVVDETIEWQQSEYEHIFEDGTGLMKVHRGKTYKYLGMTLDFSHDDQ